MSAHILHQRRARWRAATTSANGKRQQFALVGGLTITGNRLADSPREHGRRAHEIPVDRMSVTFSERQTNIVSVVNRDSEAL